MKRLLSKEGRAELPPGSFNAGLYAALSFLVLAAVIITVSTLYYLSYAKRYRTETGRDLLAIAELKVDGLSRWRKERIGDGEVFYNNPVFSRLVRRFLAQPEDADAGQQLRSWLGKIQSYYQYERVFLLDTQAVERLSVPSLTTPIEDASAHVAEAFHSGRVTLMSLHRHAPGQPIVLGVLVPVFDEVNTNRPLGVLILQIDPKHYLFPFIQRWPIPSETAETLLVRREGDSVLFLNELRFQTNAALNLSIPLTHANLPAVKAVLGQEGLVTGLDYRNQPVLAALKAVPDSPWYMVARQDTDEIYAPITTRLWQTFLMVAVLLFSAAAGTGLVWRQQRARFYRERFEAAQMLFKEQEFQRTLLDNLADGVVACDAQGNLILFNRVAKEWHGMDPLVIPPEEWGNYYNLYEPDGTTPLSGESVPLLRSFRGEVLHDIEMSIVANGQPPRQILASSCPFYDDRHNLLGAVAIMHDITARKRSEEQILRNESRLEGLVRILQSRAETMQEFLDQALAEALRVTDSRFGYIYFYDEKTETFTLNSWSKEVMAECAVTDPQSCYELSKTGLWGEAVRQRKPIVLNDFQSACPLKKGYPEGHVELTRFATVPVFKGNQIVAVVGVANKTTDYDNSDVLQLTLLMNTVWKSVDARVAESALKETLEHLQVSNRDLEQFAYIASHDLQEPLRMVSNYVQLLERRYKDKLDQDAKDFIGYAVDGAVRMQQLIDSLLDYSRLQTRKKPFEAVELDKILERVLRDLEGRILETGAQVTAGPLPQTQGDGVQLGLVFQNLIGNALKFTGEASPRIHISAEEFSNHWKITVCDNGIGIAPEYQARIFKIFQRLHSHADYPGTGIGLAICRRVIERHGGEIGVISDSGKGSAFWFTLPKKGER